MRKIKFRVWDGNLMHNVSELLFCMGPKLDGNGLKFYGPGVGQGWIDGENVHLMQYTGLKDKNGKEIYEGDIIHMYSVMPGCDIDEVGVVKFIECAFLFEKIDGSNGWSIFNEATEIEVVGNIYENQELIKN